MSKKMSRVIACLMLVVGTIFVVVALNNPQLSWPWSNTISFTIYFTYIILMIVLFVAPFKKKG